MDKTFEEIVEEKVLSTGVLDNKEPIIAPGEIIIGELLGFDSNGRPQVIFAASSQKNVTALSTVAVTHEHKGRQVALLFADGDLTKPVIMGLIHNPLLDILDNVEFLSPMQKNDKDPFEDVSDTSEEHCRDTRSKKNNDSSPETAYIDGKKVVLEGQEEIELRCGEASIRLTKAGKILIRGKYLLNRSSGVNRILGGSVQVN